MAKVITTLSDFMQPILQNQQAQQNLSMGPLKQALMMAQAQKAMQPAKDDVFSKKMNMFTDLAKKKNLTPEQIENAQGQFLIADLLKQGGQQINMELPGGGALNIGGGAPTGGLQDVMSAFGMQPRPKGIPATKTEQSNIQRQMRGIQQTLDILPEVRKYIQFKDPATAAMADLGGAVRKFAPGLADAVGLPSSEGLAKYKSALGEVKDSLLSAYGLRSTDRTNEDVQNIIEGARFEKAEDAANRIDQLMKRLRERYSKSAKSLVIGLEGKADKQSEKKADQVVDYTEYFKNANR